MIEDLSQLSPEQLAYLEWQMRWIKTARANQLPPESGWTECGFMAGRGFGKTRVGAEWIGRAAYEDPLALPSYVIAPTQSDVRFTCFEGESGLLSVLPHEIVKDYNRSDLILTLTNGAQLRGFSAEKPDRLRGPQGCRAWCFIAGTMVATPEGDRPLETLRPGDHVLTRAGPRRVLANSRRLAEVGAVQIGAANLVGTADHPVYAARGWTRMDRLCVGEPVCVLAAGSLSGHGWGTSAASVVSTWRPTGQQFVYCLQVEDEPEYFANGVLVHNCDELAAWQNGEDTWDMMQFGLRLGPMPQVLWTTTPKPVPLVRRLVEPKEGRVIVRGSTYDNKKNLPKSFFKNLEAYEGTKIGRQELDGELLDPEEAGIIRRSWFNLWPRGKPLPRLEFIVLSLDTAYTEATRDKKTGDADPTACAVFGLFYVKRTAHVILLDCWDEHLGLPELIRRVKREMNTPYGDDEDNALIKPLFGSGKPLTSGRKPDVLLIEDKGSGISLRQMLAEAKLEAYAYNPGRADKLSRLHIVSPIFSQRRVWLPESDKLPGKPRTWCEPLLAQLCAFTGEGSTKHDDYVDATSQAMRLLIDKGLLKLVKEPLVHAPPPKEASNPYAS